MKASEYSMYSAMTVADRDVARGGQRIASRKERQQHLTCLFSCAATDTYTVDIVSYHLDVLMVEAGSRVEI